MRYQSKSPKELKQRDATTNLFEWLKSETLKQQMLAQMWSNRCGTFIVGGNVKWCSHWKIASVSYKTRHSFTIQLNNHAPCYLPKGVEILHPYKTYTWVFITSSCIIAKTWKQLSYLVVGEWLNCSTSR